MSGMGEPSQMVLGLAQVRREGADAASGSGPGYGNPENKGGCDDIYDKSLQPCGDAILPGPIASAGRGGRQRLMPK